MHDWISFIAIWTCVPLATIAVFEGTRTLTLHRTSRIALLFLLVGGGFLLGRAGFLYWGHSQLSATIERLSNSKPVPSLSREEFKDNSDSDFTERTKLRASIVFSQTGELGTYTDIAGREERYIPSEKEIELRVTNQRGITEVRAGLVFLQTQIIFLLIATVTALLSGFFAGKRKFNGTL